MLPFRTSGLPICVDVEVLWTLIYDYKQNSVRSLYASVGEVTFPLYIYIYIHIFTAKICHGPGFNLCDILFSRLIRKIYTFIVEIYLIYRDLYMKIGSRSDEKGIFNNIPNFNYEVSLLFVPRLPSYTRDAPWTTPI